MSRFCLSPSLAATPKVTWDPAQPDTRCHIPRRAADSQRRFRRHRRPIRAQASTSNRQHYRLLLSIAFSMDTHGMQGCCSPREPFEQAHCQGTLSVLSGGRAIARAQLGRGLHETLGLLPSGCFGQLRHSLPDLRVSSSLSVPTN